MELVNTCPVLLEHGCISQTVTSNQDQLVYMCSLILLYTLCSSIFNTDQQNPIHCHQTKWKMCNSQQIRFLKIMVRTSPYHFQLEDFVEGLIPGDLLEFRHLMELKIDTILLWLKKQQKVNSFNLYNLKIRGT